MSNSRSDLDSRNTNHRTKVWSVWMWEIILGSGRFTNALHKEHGTSVGKHLCVKIFLIILELITITVTVVPFEDTKAKESVVEGRAIRMKLVCVGVWGYNVGK